MAVGRIRRLVADPTEVVVVEAAAAPRAVVAVEEEPVLELRCLVLGEAEVVEEVEAGDEVEGVV